MRLSIARSLVRCPASTVFELLCDPRITWAKSPKRALVWQGLDLEDIQRGGADLTILDR